MNGKVTLPMLSVLASFNVVSAGLGTGGCPKSVQAMNNFDINKYVGRWYEYSSFGTIFEANGKCVQASYKLQNDGTVSVVNSMIDKQSLKPQSIRGSAKLEDSSGAAKLAVTLPILRFFQNTSPLWVLGTDYENYSVAYSCVDFFVLHFDFGWVLSRASSLEETNLNEVEQIMTNNGLQPSQFKRQIQDCGAIDCDNGDCDNNGNRDNNGNHDNCDRDDCDSDYSDCGCGQQNLPK